MAAFPKPMAPAIELACAEQLLELRRGLWVSLLSYPPFIDAILDHVEQALAAEPPPTAAIARLRRAAASLRDRDVHATEHDYTQARDALALALHTQRGEAAIVRTLLAEIRSIGRRGGRPSPLLDVRTPPRNSAPFRRYLASLRRAESELIAARQRFVAANLRLVVTIARRYTNSFLTQADLIQEGTLGLLRAVDGYEPARGTRFSTYAAWWIRHGISRALANHGLTVRVPANVLGLRTQVHRAERAFVAEHGRAPSDAELAQVLEVPTKAISNARQAGANSVELLDDGESIVDLDALDLDAALDLPVVRTEVEQVLGQLPAIEGAVIRRRFALDGDPPMTLSEIGAVHRLSRERIRQLEKQALRRIRGALESRGLTVYDFGSGFGSASA